MARPSDPFLSEGLRDECVSPEAVERVWSRLEEDLGRPVVKVRRPVRWVWGGVALAAAFMLGVWVGDQGQSSLPESASLILAEPPRPTVLPASVQAPTRNEEAKPRPFEQALERTTRARNSARVRSLPLAPLEMPLPPSPESEVVASATADFEPAPVADVVSFPEWQRLANGGDYEAALFELGQSGGFESVLGRATAEQLMLLVDVARATGQRQRALAALRRVVTQFPREPVAPLAAWSLGNLLEKSGDAQGAARAFAVYRSLSPDGDFAEDALVRQLQSAVKQSDRERASRLLTQYETEFPEARRVDEVSRLREQLYNPGLEADAGAPQAASPAASAEPEDEPAAQGD